MSRFVLGIDSSTTATKAVLVEPSGRVAAVGSAEYGYETPRPLWSEQDPALWWNATIEAVGSALSAADATGGDVAAVGLTGQMHGLVLLDAAGKPIRPAILWNDQRTAAECDEIRSRVGRRLLIDTTGNDALTGFTAPKLLWVRNHEPEVFGRIATMLLPKDYVRLRLTSARAMDRAGGSGTQLFDLARRTWSPDIVEALEIDPAWLPDTFEGPDVTGFVTAEAAAATGLAAGTPVVAGGGDQAANAVGVGATTPGIVALSLGTSGVVFTTTLEPTVEPEGRLHAFCHALADRWHLMGVMLSAAGSLRWFRDAVSPGASFSQLSDLAASAPPGSEGLVFLPYLTGERTPHPDPEARAAFVGLTVRHRIEHMTRAVMEGVAFGLRDGLDLMVGAGIAAPVEIRASGGGVRSALWRRILADVLEAEVTVMDVPEGAAIGAAALATPAAGWFREVGEASDTWTATGETTAPGPDVARYRDLHEAYAGLYPALRETFGRLG
jgi:xylulokinase